MSSPLSFIRKFYPNRIWQQILLILIVLVIPPVVILGSRLITMSQNATKTTVLHNYRQVAVNATGKVEEKVNNVRQLLHATASVLGVLHADAWRQESAIVELALQYPGFRRISSIDLNGMEIATSNLGMPFQDRVEEEAFQAARTGKSYVSQVTVAQDHMPVLNMAVPIRQMGKITGVLMAEVNIRGVWDIIDSIRFGKTGRAYLVDRQGRIIAHPDKKLILKETPSERAGIQDFFYGEVGSSEIKDRNGKLSSLIAYAPIKSLGWELVIEQSAAEALAFSKAMKLQSWIFIVLSVLAVAAISFILARFMSRPIKMLIERTDRMAHGKFDDYFRIKRRDEIGHLFFSFNRMARKLQQAQAAERLSIVGKAATAIAHELKNSLLLVNTFIELLPGRHRDKKFIDEFSSTIPRELDSWNRMLRNMMDFSRLDTMPMEFLDINGLLSDMIDLAKFRVSQERINFDVKIQSDLPGVLGNADKLKQVFLNLITNCIEATPAGGTIAVGADYVEKLSSWAPAYVEIRVANSGQGVSSSNLGKIFEPFYTTKDQGLGLGLSISKEIVKHHGGRIEAISEENKGALFVVQLPAASAPQASSRCKNTESGVL